MKRVVRSDLTGVNASLLRKLSGDSALPAYIRQLPASAVVRLIDQVGLEDSHEIIAAMDAQQFRETMAIALWSSPATGHEEVLDIEQLVRWMELWTHESDSMLARRLTELGEDFIVTCLRQLLYVIDRTVSGVISQGVEFGNYVVNPKEQKHWPRIVEALVALWSQEPDFLLRVLRRCSPERSILSETPDNFETQDASLHDLTAERAEQRVQAGHVSPMHAALFLSAAKAAPLEELCALEEYDLNTAFYLEKAERLAPDWARAGEQSQPSVSPVGLLPSRGVLCLEAAIAALATTHPEIASKRMRELAYLANVLVSGAESQGKGYTERRAAHAAVAVANLGATFVQAETLERDPGVVRLFQIGFRLLADVPLRCCEAVYRAKDVQSRRRGHVVYIEMEEVLGTSVLTDLVNEGRYGEAKSVVDGLSSVMDSAACVALRTLIDPIPAFPNVLASIGGQTPTYVDRGHRPITTVQDLERIGWFLATLSDYCGN